MWTRAELKDRARKRFKANYWRCVVVGLILAVIMGGSAGYPGNSGGSVDRRNNVRTLVDGISENSENVKSAVEDITSSAIASRGIVGTIRDEFSSLDTIERVALTTVISVVFIVVIVFTAIIGIFILNPILVGCCRFFVKNLNEEAKLGELTAGFGKEYKNIVKIMFFQDLFIFLWFLLLVIPGIIKAYEYRMIPYIIGENPDLSMEEVFAKSKEMMDGNKWDAFVLDLSFIGWYLLSLITFGIVGLLYVNPYMFQTDAALFERLSYDNRAFEVYDNYIEVG